jgi:hypothetical protein
MGQELEPWQHRPERPLILCRWEPEYIPVFGPVSVRCRANRGYIRWGTGYPVPMRMFSNNGRMSAPRWAANLTGKSRLQIGQAHVIAPAAGVDHDRMRALVVGAVDDEPGRAGLPHFSEGDLLRALYRMVAPAPRVEAMCKEL